MPLQGLSPEGPALLERPKKALSDIERASYPRLMRNILLIILILLLIGAFPGWGYSSGWGYYPFGGVGLVLLIVLILALTGRLRSEEHTSELQSRSDLVCRLLLEKKKNSQSLPIVPEHHEYHIPR